MLDKSENLPLGVNLNKPQEKGEIISCIEPVPESADHKNPQLWNSSAFEGRSLVNTFSQPLLNGNVPMGYFVSNVFVSFDHYWTACVDKSKLMPIVGDAACMYTGNTQFPSKVVLESDECDT